MGERLSHHREGSSRLGHQLRASSTKWLGRLLLSRTVKAKPLPPEPGSGARADVKEMAYAAVFSSSAEAVTHHPDVGVCTRNPVDGRIRAQGWWELPGALYPKGHRGPAIMLALTVGVAPYP